MTYTYYHSEDDYEIYSNYSSGAFDAEIKRMRKREKDTSVIRTTRKWQKDSYGSASISYCSMDRIYEAYAEYKESKWY